MSKKITYLILFVLIISFLYVGFNIAENQELGNAAQIILDETVSKTSAINSVTAVVFDFRGYDTLGESIVLFTAICGVSTVLRRTAKSKGADKDDL